jgi:hypothetical protein
MRRENRGREGLARALARFRRQVFNGDFVRRHEVGTLARGIKGRGRCNFTGFVDDLGGIARAGRQILGTAEQDERYPRGHQDQ